MFERLCINSCIVIIFYVSMLFNYLLKIFCWLPASFPFVLRYAVLSNILTAFFPISGQKTYSVLSWLCNALIQGPTARSCAKRPQARHCALRWSHGCRQTQRCSLSSYLLTQGSTFAHHESIRNSWPSEDDCTFARTSCTV